MKIPHPIPCYGVTVAHGPSTQHAKAVPFNNFWYSRWLEAIWLAVQLSQTNKNALNNMYKYGLGKFDLKIFVKEWDIEVDVKKKFIVA